MEFLTQFQHLLAWACKGRNQWGLHIWYTGEDETKVQEDFKRDFPPAAKETQDLPAKWTYPLRSEGMSLAVAFALDCSVTIFFNTEQEAKAHFQQVRSEKYNGGTLEAQLYSPTGICITETL